MRPVVKQWRPSTNLINESRVAGEAIKSALRLWQKAQNSIFHHLID